MISLTLNGHCIVVYYIIASGLVNTFVCVISNETFPPIVNHDCQFVRRVIICVVLAIDELYAIIRDGIKVGCLDTTWPFFYFQLI